ncbi:hypothetical protein D0C36_17170 [Mucilaginibacter conchicola]|uniref:histidine kinase n=1 Tax=Mucilaginibacter conchicola TaxID=2303333 RepID=A0A372NR05_9SPHI|nr:histidine kinase dimerization/phosphoacceptor domain -containing protein [Mucilaginibacter conchicola]RFZ90693.1 hypothetical protein D0C36_17170 [Mucilaginibacter conchicola]
MKYVGCLFIIFVSLVTKAQVQRTDAAYLNTLTRRLQNQTTDTGRISAYMELAKYHNSRFFADQDTNNINNAIQSLKSAISIAGRIKDQKRQYEGVRLIANNYINKGDTVSSYKYFSEALKYYTAGVDHKKLVSVYMSFASAASRSDFYPISILYLQKALAAAQQYRLQQLVPTIQIAIVMATWRNGQGNDAVKEAHALIAKYQSKPVNLSVLYDFLAGDYRYKGDLKKALAYGLLSVDDIEKYRDTLNGHNTYGEVGLIYEALGKTEESIIYLRKSLAAREKMVIKEIYRYRTLGFIIKGLIKLGRFNEALQETTAYELKHPPQTNDGRVFCTQNKAYCYEALKDYAKAEKAYKKVIETIGIRPRDGEVVALAYYDISSFYIKTGKYERALLYLSKIRARSSLDNNKNIEQLYYKIDSAMGKYQSALTHFGNYQRQKDSLLNASKLREISEMQLKYETAQRENDIALLKKDAQLQRDQLKQAGHTRNLTFAGVIFLLVSIGLLYNSYRINIKKTREIDEKNISLNALIEEKEWLMKEIHHRVKNNLQIVMGLLQRQSSYIDNAAALKAIKNSEYRIHAIALIHQKLYQSDDLTLINMQEYIEELLTHLKETSDAESRIIFIKNIEEIYLHVAQAVPLGLIINEAVTNAIKYAYPDNGHGNIRIVFKQLNDDQTRLLIEDEGIGITENANSKSMGMNLMKGLTKQLGGKLELLATGGVTIGITFKNNQTEPPV